jgi:hypothetical protein
MPIPLLFAASVVVSTLAARLPPITIPAHSSTTTIDVNVAASRRQLASIDATHDIVLDLDGIEAPRPPAVYFEVYVHAKNAPIGRSVGNVALYGMGIRSERRFRPAHVQLVITDEIREALRRSSMISITFVAQGAGGTASPRSASVVTIAKPSIVIVPRTRE